MKLFSPLSQCSSTSKQQILGLVKKLERLVYMMQLGSGSDSGKTENETGGNEVVTTVRDEPMATTSPTKKAKVVKERGLFQITIKYKITLEKP